MEEFKSLDQWRKELTTIGKKHWLVFYKELMEQDAVPMRLYRALKLYGDWPVFEAILDSSNRELTGEKINYVLKVAHEKWKSEQQKQDSDTDYDSAIERAKEITMAKNASLAARAEGRKPTTRKRRVKTE